MTPEFYNVVHAVGKECPNKHDDVKLVQVLLQMFYTGSGLVMPKGQVVADGICGPITRNWILKLQLDMRARAVSTPADQRMDRVRNHQSIGVILNAKYGLLALNEAAATVDPAAWSNIPLFVPMQDANTVPPPSYQSTSPR